MNRIRLSSFVMVGCTVDREKSNGSTLSFRYTVDWQRTALLEEFHMLAFAYDLDELVQGYALRCLAQVGPAHVLVSWAGVGHPPAELQVAIQEVEHRYSRVGARALEVQAAREAGYRPVADRHGEILRYVPRPYVVPLATAKAQTRAS